jgi:hypothetical protein
MGKSLVRSLKSMRYPSQRRLVNLSLTVYYTDGYPDELPKLSLELLEGEIDEEEVNGLLDSAQAVVSILASIGFMRCTDF